MLCNVIYVDTWSVWVVKVLDNDIHRCSVEITGENTTYNFVFPCVTIIWSAISLFDDGCHVGV